MTWTNLVNVTANGSSIQKTGGCDTCWDAGGEAGPIPGDSGAFTFQVSAGGSASLLADVGIAPSLSSPPDPNQFDYGFSIWGNGGWGIYELGTYQTDGTYSPGDTFKISIEAGPVVKYYINGTLVYTSPTAPSASSYLLGALLITSGSAVENAMSTGGSTSITLPQLPQVTVDTAFPVATGQTINVLAGGDLQEAINVAEPGDVISIQAGATFTGNFILPVKSGSGYVIIRTSTPDNQLPPQGTRITPNQASLLPKLVSPNSQPALATVDGAHHYWIFGIEFEVADGVSQNYDLIDFGSTTQTSLASVPHHLVIDRCYIHGTATNTIRRAVALNSATSAVIDSYISDIHEAGADNQAIAGWNGPGPFKIENNYLEAAGENVLFGGADPAITDLVPSDITFVHNQVAKQPAWQDSSWQMKNIFELKNAQRVLVDGNIFEYNWPAAQDGFAILLTVRNQDGTAPWSTVQDVTFTHNVVQHVAAVFNILGTDNNYSSQREQRLLIQHNLLLDVGGSTWGGKGTLFQVLSGPENLTIDHNTGLQTTITDVSPGDPIEADGSPTDAAVITNNIFRNGQYGVGGAGTYGNPMLSLSTWFPNVVFQANALIGGQASEYPSGNVFPPDDASVGFTDEAGGDYSLMSTSPYHNAGADGTDLGVDWSALESAVAGVLDGSEAGS